MITFRLKNNVLVVPTSFHGSRFSDGTVFEPSQEQIEQIKSDWSLLTIKREFEPVEGIPVPTSRSRQIISNEALAALKAAEFEPGNTVVLVSFMVASALHESGRRGNFPHVLATNATPETARSKPEEKIWDVGNFAW
jgi:hypothetical protein